MEINDQHRPGKSSNCAFRNSDRPYKCYLSVSASKIGSNSHRNKCTPLEIKQAMKIKKISSFNIETHYTPMNRHFPDLPPTNWNSI